MSEAIAEKFGYRRRRCDDVLGDSRKIRLSGARMRRCVGK